MGTLNLTFHPTKPTKKTKSKSEPPGLRKRPKCDKNGSILKIDNIGQHFRRFLSTGGSDFDFVFFIGLFGSNVKFRVPTWLLSETLF